MLLDSVCGTKQIPLPCQDALNTVGEILMLFGRDIQSSKVKDKPLTGSLSGANVFDQMEVFVDLLGVGILFPDLFDIHEMLIPQGEGGSQHKNTLMGHYIRFMETVMQ